MATKPEAAIQSFRAPPRDVPLSTRLWVTLGGLTLAAWLAFGFSSIFFWVFPAQADLSFLTFRGEIRRAEGRVLASRDTGASEGGGKHSRGTPIYALDYEFAGADGVSRTGVSYSLGHRHGTGDAVEIEYRGEDPGASRIRGLRRAIWGPWVLLVACFPGLATGFLWFCLGRGLRAVHLLEQGAYGLATLRSKEPTSTRVNKRMVYALSFEFTADDGRAYTVKERTHEPEHLEDEAREIVLYEPGDPASAILLDNAPGGAKVDRETGEVQPVGAAKAGLAVLAAAGVVGGNALWATRHLFH